MGRVIGCVYINGLGDGSTTSRERVMVAWWRRVRIDIVHAHVNWYDGESLEPKLVKAEDVVRGMMAQFDVVVIIGSSAGGSLALNVFDRLKSKKVCVVIVHGRVKVGTYRNEQSMSLHRRARIGQKNSSQSFFDSVQMTDTEVIPRLREKDKKRILVLTQLADFVVPIDCMRIGGVTEHRCCMLGHSGAGFSHLVVDRDRIIKFATEGVKIE
jgi:hypothetical protein